MRAIAGDGGGAGRVAQGRGQEGRADEGVEPPLVQDVDEEGPREAAAPEGGADDDVGFIRADQSSNCRVSCRNTLSEPVKLSVQR